MKNLQISTFLILLLISVVSCKSNLIKFNKKSKINGSEYVVLKFDSELNYPFPRDYKSIELSSYEILDIEKIIDEKITKVITLHNKNKAKPDNYKRQYVPVLNAKGEKEIWINFFCGDISGTGWKDQILFVSDGGDCYFKLKVNLNSKTFYAYSQNGYG